MGRKISEDEVEYIEDKYERLDAKEKEEERYRRQKKLVKHNLKTLKSIKPITKNQEKAFHSFFSEKNLLLYGFAGTGKTYIGLYLALNELIKGNHRKICIVRSAVNSRDIGFLPGTIQEKIALYEVPYREMMKDLLERGDGYDLLKSKHTLEFMTTSFLRGITIDDAVIVVDEVQNMTDHEISSILTRVGQNCRVILCGDFMQDDLKINSRGKNQESGMEILLDTVKRMGCFDCIEFQIEDIVRSGFVKEYIIARHYSKYKK